MDTGLQLIGQFVWPITYAIINTITCQWRQQATHWCVLWSKGNFSSLWDEPVMFRSWWREAQIKDRSRRLFMSAVTSAGVSTMSSHSYPHEHLLFLRHDAETSHNKTAPYNNKSVLTKNKAKVDPLRWGQRWKSGGDKRRRSCLQARWQHWTVNDAFQAHKKQENMTNPWQSCNYVAAAFSSRHLESLEECAEPRRRQNHWHPTSTTMTTTRGLQTGRAKSGSPSQNIGTRRKTIFDLLQTLSQRQFGFMCWWCEVLTTMWAPPVASTSQRHRSWLLLLLVRCQAKRLLAAQFYKIVLNIIR